MKAPADPRHWVYSATLAFALVALAILSLLLPGAWAFLGLVPAVLVAAQTYGLHEAQRAVRK